MKGWPAKQFAVFPLSQLYFMLVLVAYFIGVSIPMVAALLVLGIVIGVAANLRFFSALKSIAQKTKLETEQHYLETQVEIQEEHFHKLAAQKQAMESMYYDILKKVDTLQNILETSEPLEAMDCIKTLYAPINERKAEIVCPNSIVEVLLLYKAEKAEQEGIAIDMRVFCENSGVISNVDLVCALSNLFDNAIEACAGQKGADNLISIRIAPHGNYLAICFENPLYPRSEAARGPDRGYGLRILQDIAEKYKGNLQAQPQGGLYRAALTLRMYTQESQAL